MKQNNKPIKQWEKAGRGIVDPTGIMNTMIKPNYPESIQDMLSDLDEETQNDIKEIFNYFVPSIKDCGEFVFTCEKFELLNMAFVDINNEDEQAKFVNLFFELNILERCDE